MYCSHDDLFLETLLTLLINSVLTEQVVQYSRPGYFADLDILEIGNGGLSHTEEQSVFSLWCALKSPLLLGNNISSISPQTLSVPPPSNR